jgi:hypothetical protein
MEMSALVQGNAGVCEAAASGPAAHSALLHRQGRLHVVHLTERHHSVGLTLSRRALSDNAFAVQRDVRAPEELLNRCRCIQKYDPSARGQAAISGDLKYFDITLSSISH